MDSKAGFSPALLKGMTACPLSPIYADLVAGYAEWERRRAAIHLLTGADYAEIDAAAARDPGGWAGLYGRVTAGGPLEWSLPWYVERFAAELLGLGMSAQQAGQAIRELQAALPSRQRPPRRERRRARKRQGRG